MSSPARNQLWNPSSGIRFSPNNNTKPVYPVLDMPRFIHGASPNQNRNAQPMNVDTEEFDEDEQFELDATEWFDDQDALMAPVPPVQGIELSHQKFEEPEVATDETSGPPPEPEDDVKAGEKIVPPVTSLDYKMSNKLFQAARAKRVGTLGSFWSHTMYEHIKDDGSTEKVTVHYCTSKDDMEDVCKQYFLGEKVLGFDLEWMAFVRKSSEPRQNVSLIQIASPGHIGLFHVGVFTKDDFVAPTFRKIMEDEGVSKVGVNIRGDCTRLKKFLDIETKGIFELSHLYRLVKHSKEGQLNRVNKRLVAMAIQVRDCLRLPLFKGEVRTSNWLQGLSPSQIAYSASDAYAGIQLYYVLEHEREKLDPCPPRPEFSEKGLPIKVAVAVDEVVDADEDVEIDLSINETEGATEAVAQATQYEAIVTVPEPQEVEIPKKEPLKKEASKHRDPRITAADLKLELYRAQKQHRLYAAPSALRTYYMWYTNDDLSPESIAKLLRDPPLKTNTVVTYILDSIALEKLPFPKDRLRSEVISFLVPKYIPNKYKALIQESKEMEDT